jgi:molybdate transport system ATP-binding protein
MPFVHVTHDLAEALRVGTRLVLLERGAVVQVGVPAEVIARPASLAAARAVGTENVLSGTVLRHSTELGWSQVDLGGTIVHTGPLDRPPGSRVTLGLRAEEVLIALGPLGANSARNLIPGRIEALSDVGAGIEATVATPVPLRAMLTAGSVRELGLERGMAVQLVIKASAFRHLA